MGVLCVSMGVLCVSKTHDTTLGVCSLYTNSETVSTNMGFGMLCLCCDPFYFGGKRTTTSIDLSTIMFIYKSLTSSYSFVFWWELFTKLAPVLSLCIPTLQC